MGCFVVPVAGAIVTNVIAKSVKAKDMNSTAARDAAGEICFDAAHRIPFARKLKWLTNLLWGGSALLAFEHVWHGEVVPWFPFLTGATDPAAAADMLSEMATVGVAMVALTVAVWGVMLLVTGAMEKKARKGAAAQKLGEPA